MNMPPWSYPCAESKSGMWFEGKHQKFQDFWQRGTPFCAQTPNFYAVCVSQGESKLVGKVYIYSSENDRAWMHKFDLETAGLRAIPSIFSGVGFRHDRDQRWAEPGVKSTSFINGGGRIGPRFVILGWETRFYNPAD